ncbi:siderophore ABC transporter substrate-binding protein [Aerococcus sanguinicola]|uniref:siderophore ABC transporter substrate-binding protein n=1 Tax=unclassified Aerococcus TaxID=2618060 RepID=UPI0008A10B96|nr:MULTISPECIES: siderophore ABC transporter substrate-binding protein [unclassified Aerococcus]MDK6233388.1 siderophore ABC transporter substrate-binding protein [Aerococcus sp. UMB10185]MDK6855217.1 siderophore ABC transporter substrate-binding protein [Aerococcus sp. UMB7533]OFN04398.1 iron ABC transporter substrate-binding protein [Aerococcus sp. HMSC062A02]OHO43041.1 iron ABC transporter substrate-binding protein [Aerococcus sp. HMSC035B07]
MKEKALKVALVSLSMLALGACSQGESGQSNQSNQAESSQSATSQTEESTSAKTDVKAETVEIQDATGKVEVPKNPQKVVALDNRTFQSLEEWGIKPVAVPKDVMPGSSAFVKDDSVQNIGNHREPNLEIIAAEQPDLVIVGQRFADYYDDIKKLVPEATVINLDINVSEDSEHPGQDLVDGLKNSSLALGKIFDKEDEAKKDVEALDASIKRAKEAYNGEDKVMALVVSGGELGFSAPHFGRVWGPLYDIFNWKPALEVANESSDHKGDDVSVEAIAESNPDWLMVLDRDAAISKPGEKSQPAKDVLENAKALTNTTAVKDQKIVYAPEDTYTNESIQTFTEIFNRIADAMSK